MPRRDSRLLAALFLSGTAALGYELLWTRLLGLALGHEFLGVLAALAGYFGGLAIGAALLHERVRRARDPARLFAGLELAIASYALVSPLLLAWLADWVPAVVGPAGAGAGAGAMVLSLLLATLVLAPATVCMGASLPALMEARARAIEGQPHGLGLGRLYAANTAGAVLGTLLAVHVVLPRLGLWGGAVVIAALGVGAAAIAWSWSRDHGRLPARATDEAGDAIPPRVDTSRDPDPELVREPWLLYALVLCTGLVGVGVEVVGVRVLAQTMSNTVYTFADVLAVFLLGNAAGAWIYQRWALRAVAGAPARVTAALLVAQSLTVVVAATALRASPQLLAGLSGASPGFFARVAGESLTALAVFLLPTLVMGALFSHLVGLLAARGIGRAYALNTLGAALAPFVVGLFALPRLGLTDGFFALAWAYLVLSVIFCWFRRFSSAWQLGSMIAVLLATVLGRGSLVLVEIPEGWTVVEQHQSALGVVTVSERKTGKGAGEGSELRRLQVDQQFRMGGALSIGERRMGHLPLLLHQGERPRVLFLGVGTGATAGAALAHDVDSVDAVELVPEVLQTLHHFHDINGALDEDPRVRLHAADARRWLAASDQTWDVIVADLFHPQRDGAGFLYAREHFEQVRAHLAEGGTFVQWLPLHQLDPDTLRTIVATFLDVFPEADSWLALYNVESPALGLFGTVGGGGDPPPVDVERLTATTADAAFASVVLQDPRDLLAGHMLDAAGLSTFAADAPINTDLRPRVLFDAARIDLGEHPGITNLEHLLPLRGPYPEARLAHAPPELPEQAAAFARALDHYLAGEIVFVRHARAGEPMPEQAVEQYVAAYEAAPEFLPVRGRLRAQIALLQRNGLEDEAHALVQRLEGG